MKRKQNDDCGRKATGTGQCRVSSSVRQSAHHGVACRGRRGRTAARAPYRYRGLGRGRDVRRAVAVTGPFDRRGRVAEQGVRVLAAAGRRTARHAARTAVARDRPTAATALETPRPVPRRATGEECARPFGAGFKNACFSKCFSKKKKTFFRHRHTRTFFSRRHLPTVSANRDGALQLFPEPTTDFPGPFTTTAQGEELTENLLFNHFLSHG